MNIPATDARRRAALALVFGLLAGLYVMEATRVWLAAEWTASSDPKLWRRASRLEPGNATVWDRLGSSEMQSWEGAGLLQAVRDFKTAAKANPHSDRIWMDLAEAEETRGDVSGARAAFDKAELAHPISSEVAWRYGNFLLRQGNISEAFTKFRHALEANGSLRWNVLSVCEKASGDTGRILDEALPRSSDMYLSAVNYFSNEGRLDSALTAWNRFVGLAQPFKLQDALPLLNGLIRQGRAQEAQRVWGQALESTGWPRNPSTGPSPVFNGGFEHELAGGGFDWEVTPIAGATIDRDPSIFHEGTHSLRVTFDGSENLDFRNVAQYVAVEPGRVYDFSAYLRTDALSTDSGIRFELIGDNPGGRTHSMTPDIEGTHPWTQIGERFAAGPETRLMFIVLRRLPSEKFDNQLRGTVWLDDVSLTPVPAGRGSSLP